MRRYAPFAAFTLLELLVVIAIVVSLFALGFGAVGGVRQRAASARAQSELALLETALEEFKRVHGDYPRTGGSVAGSQVVVDSAGPPAQSAQALFFNALTGVLVSPSFGTTTKRGPMLVELSRFSTERPLDAEIGRAFVRNAFVDPWGNRYLYFYRSAAAGSWESAGYVLFSAGPDGKVGALPNVSGEFSADDRSAGANADNVYSGTAP